MISVVYIVHALFNPSGLERVLIQKANFLAATGRYRITIITSRQRGLPPAFELHPAIKMIDLKANYYSLFGSVIFRIRLSWLLRKTAPDIIDSAASPKLGYLPRLKCPGKKIAEFHFSYFSLFTQDCSKQVADRFRRQVGRFHRFVVLTLDDARDWAPYSDRICQIYNPCTLQGQADLTSRNIALVGRLTPQKNPSDAIKAWKIVSARHPDWKLNIYGEGRLRPVLEQQIKEYGMEGKVLLHGIVNGIYNHLKMNSIMIMSSLYEGFPLCLIEGCALGMPLVSYDCKCGPAEVITDGENGYLVPQGNVSTLAERICTLIENPSLRAAMGQSAQNTAKRFRLEPIMSEWDKLFTQLASEK